MQIQLNPSIQPIETAQQLGTPHPTDVAKFEDVFYLTPISELPANDPLNLNSAFFDGLETANRSHDDMVTRLEAALDQVVNEPELSISSLLRVQVELATVSFHEQLTVKVVDKTSEGIKTLFRNQ